MIILLAVIVYLIFRPRPLPALRKLTAAEGKLLLQHVHYYRALETDDRKRFVERMELFWQRVKITGADTGVEPLDRVLVAACAVMLTFGFEHWNQYPRLREVLLYKDDFREEDFATHGQDRDVEGMVGEGMMSDVLLLSQPALRDGFYYAGPENTGIHEFAHLLDMADGETNGIPSYFLDGDNRAAWVETRRKTSEAIERGDSDLDDYALTNGAEFFAVAAEYFFDDPDYLAEEHPELLALLENVFRQDLVEGELEREEEE